jgi:hypothetical protein
LSPKNIEETAPKKASSAEKSKDFLNSKSPVATGFFFDFFNLSSLTSKQLFIEKLNPKENKIIRKNNKIFVNELVYPLETTKPSTAIKKYPYQSLIRNIRRYDFI